MKYLRSGYAKQKKNKKETVMLKLDRRVKGTRDLLVHVVSGQRGVKSNDRRCKDK